MFHDDIDTQQKLSLVDTDLSRYIEFYEKKSENHVHEKISSTKTREKNRYNQINEIKFQKQQKMLNVMCELINLKIINDEMSIYVQ